MPGAQNGVRRLQIELRTRAAWPYGAPLLTSSLCFMNPGGRNSVPWGPSFPPRGPVAQFPPNPAGETWKKGAWDVRVWTECGQYVWMEGNHYLY